MLTLSFYELQRLLINRRAWASATAFVLFWLGCLFYFILRGAALLEDEASRPMLQSLLGALGMSSWYDWSSVEVALYSLFVLLILPMLLVFWCADQTASDRQRGSLRFISLRSSRNSIFYGRFLGHCMIALVLLGFTALTFLLGVILADGLSLAVIGSTLIVLLNGVLAALPIVALMAFLSARANSPRQAILQSFLLYIGLLILFSIITHYLPALELIHYLRPSYYAFEMVKFAEWQSLQLAYVPLLQTALFLGLGQWTINRSAL